MEILPEWKEATEKWRQGASMRELTNEYNVPEMVVRRWVSAVSRSEADNAITRLKAINKAREKADPCKHCAWRPSRGACVLPGCFRDLGRFKE